MKYSPENTTSSSNQLIYNLLEEKMLNYTDYATIPVLPSAELLVPIPTIPGLSARAVREDMKPYTGDQIYVRTQVLDRLTRAATQLLEYDNSLELEVGYGYRSLEVQTRRFEEQKTRLQSQYNSEELLSRAHKFVAVPEVAGHPAGAAVDIQLIRDDLPLNFGTKLWEFQPDSFTFSPFITKEAWRNRQLLRNIMMSAGFAPFDGEWWHFSYGDKEWARYYNKPAALYDQVNFNVNNKLS